MGGGGGVTGNNIHSWSIKGQVLSQALHAQVFLKKQKADYIQNIIKGPILYRAARMAEKPKLSTGKAAPRGEIQGGQASAGTTLKNGLQANRQP